MKSINDCRLYGILDTGYVAPEAMPQMAQLMISGGVDILQVRAKGCTALQVKAMLAAVRPISREAGIPLVVNDFPELAPDADAVHVGQDDAPLAQIRAQHPELAILGKSTHSLSQAVAAAAEGADYIGFGPLFPTPTKAGRPSIGIQDIAAVHRQVSIPIFCIGGIKRENLPEVIAAGARRIVVVSGILQAADVIGYTRDCLQLLPA
jgi:thiamine-phosphate pyrophosphorylase